MLHMPREQHWMSTHAMRPFLCLYRMLTGAYDMPYLPPGCRKLSRYCCCAPVSMTKGRPNQRLQCPEMVPFSSTIDASNSTIVMYLVLYLVRCVEACWRRWYIAPPAVRAGAVGKLRG